MVANVRSLKANIAAPDSPYWCNGHILIDYEAVPAKRQPVLRKHVDPDRVGHYVPDDQLKDLWSGALNAYCDRGPVSMPPCSDGHPDTLHWSGPYPYWYESERAYVARAPDGSVVAVDARAADYLNSVWPGARWIYTGPYQALLVFAGNDLGMWVKDCRPPVALCMPIKAGEAQEQWKAEQAA